MYGKPNGPAVAISRPLAFTLGRYSSPSLAGRKVPTHLVKEAYPQGLRVDYYLCVQWKLPDSLHTQTNFRLQYITYVHLPTRKLYHTSFSIAHYYRSVLQFYCSSGTVSLHRNLPESDNKLDPALWYGILLCHMIIPRLQPEMTQYVMSPI